MTTTLFGDEGDSGYFLDLHYEGESFAGHIEIEKLARELTGLDVAIRLAVESLARHKRIAVPARDIVIVVEPFENGSFRKKLKVIIKNMDKHAGAYQASAAIAVALLTAYGTIKTKTISEITEMSPKLQAEIRDEVGVELLKNKDFLRGVAAASYPLSLDKDKLTLSTPWGKSENICLDDKFKLDAVAGMAELEAESIRQETLVGRISRVDLDATINHLGFKVDGKGGTIKVTLVDDLTQEEKHDLLGRWVKIAGKTYYRGDSREKIDVVAIETVEPPSQQELGLSN